MCSMSVSGGGGVAGYEWRAQRPGNKQQPSETGQTFRITAQDYATKLGKDADVMLTPADRKELFEKGFLDVQHRQTVQESPEGLFTIAGKAIACIFGPSKSLAQIKIDPKFIEMLKDPNVSIGLGMTRITNHSLLISPPPEDTNKPGEPQDELLKPPPSVEEPVTFVPGVTLMQSSKTTSSSDDIFHLAPMQHSYRSEIMKDHGDTNLGAGLSDLVYGNKFDQAWKIDHQAQQLGLKMEIDDGKGGKQQVAFHYDPAKSVEANKQAFKEAYVKANGGDGSAAGPIFDKALKAPLPTEVKAAKQAALRQIIMAMYSDETQGKSNALESAQIMTRYKNPFMSDEIQKRMDTGKSDERDTNWGFYTLKTAQTFKADFTSNPPTSPNQTAQDFTRLAKEYISNNGGKLPDNASPEDIVKEYNRLSGQSWDAKAINGGHLAMLVNQTTMIGSGPGTADLRAQYQKLSDDMRAKAGLPPLPLKPEDFAKINLQDLEALKFMNFGMKQSEPPKSPIKPSADMFGDDGKVKLTNPKQISDVTNFTITQYTNFGGDVGLTKSFGGKQANQILLEKGLTSTDANDSRRLNADDAADVTKNVEGFEAALKNLGSSTARLSVNGQFYKPATDEERNNRLLAAKVITPPEQTTNSKAPNYVKRGEIANRLEAKKLNPVDFNWSKCAEKDALQLKQVTASEIQGFCQDFGVPVSDLEKKQAASGQFVVRGTTTTSTVDLKAFGTDLAALEGVGKSPVTIAGETPTQDYTYTDGQGASQTVKLPPQMATFLTGMEKDLAAMDAEVKAGKLDPKVYEDFKAKFTAARDNAIAMCNKGYEIERTQTVASGGVPFSQKVGASITDFETNYLPKAVSQASKKNPVEFKAEHRADIEKFVADTQSNVLKHMNGLLGTDAFKQPGDLTEKNIGELATAAGKAKGLKGDDLKAFVDKAQSLGKELNAEMTHLQTMVNTLPDAALKAKLQSMVGELKEQVKDPQAFMDNAVRKGVVDKMKGLAGPPTDFDKIPEGPEKIQASAFRDTIAKNFFGADSFDKLTPKQQGQVESLRKLSAEGKLPMPATIKVGDAEMFKSAKRTDGSNESINAAIVGSGKDAVIYINPDAIKNKSQADVEKICLEEIVQSWSQAGQILETAQPPKFDEGERVADAIFKAEKGKVSVSDKGELDDSGTMTIGGKEVKVRFSSDPVLTPTENPSLAGLSDQELGKEISKTEKDLSKATTEGERMYLQGELNQLTKEMTIRQYTGSSSKELESISQQKLKPIPPGTAGIELESLEQDNATISMQVEAAKAELAARAKLNEQDASTGAPKISDAELLKIGNSSTSLDSKRALQALADRKTADYKKEFQNMSQKDLTETEGYLKIASESEPSNAELKARLQAVQEVKQEKFSTVEQKYPAELKLSDYSDKILDGISKIFDKLAEIVDGLADKLDKIANDRAKAEWNSGITTSSANVKAQGLFRDAVAGGGKKTDLDDPIEANKQANAARAAAK